MKKIFEKDKKYYRIKVKNMLTDCNIAEEQYIDLDIIDIVEKIDTLIDVVNILGKTINNMHQQYNLLPLRKYIEDLEKKVIAQGDLIASFKQEQIYKNL